MSSACGFYDSVSSRFLSKDENYSLAIYFEKHYYYIWQYMYMFLSLIQCTYTITVLAPVFAHPVISPIHILHVKCKIIGKVKMETTAM